ncbi:hypothetical protein [Pedobacter sp. V48]|uniref:hypothetical protein n=1 Tax=Pedobacter sp. V48 TaxID=509635 RepID=UPI0003E4F511|nr:hypothetical protein [Pedobacter sp. V48]ETZ20185.1 hypothetical protein N824_08205 [Pedobacter sp. V48]
MTSTSEQQQEKPTCNYCGKKLYGREGKKYCNVDCKNNYNSRIRSELRSKENEFLPDAFSKIRVNYRILNNYKDQFEKSNLIYVEKEDILKLGFNTQYCIKAYIDDKKILWKNCHDYSWSEYEGSIAIRYGMYYWM